MRRRENSSDQPATTVRQKLPPEKTDSDNGKQSNEEDRKRDQTTNYEVSSKTIPTISGGFEVEHISVAVLLNRAGLIATLGGKRRRTLSISSSPIWSRSSHPQRVRARRAAIRSRFRLWILSNPAAILRLPPPTWQEICCVRRGADRRRHRGALVAFLVSGSCQAAGEGLITSDGHWRARWLSRR